MFESLPFFSTLNFYNTLNIKFCMLRHLHHWSLSANFHLNLLIGFWWTDIWKKNWLTFEQLGYSIFPSLHKMSLDIKFLCQKEFPVLWFCNTGSLQGHLRISSKIKVWGHLIQGISMFFHVKQLWCKFFKHPVFFLVKKALFV